MGLTELARHSPAAPSLSPLSVGSNPNPPLAISNHRRAPRPTLASFGEIRRRPMAYLLRLVTRFLLTAGFCRLCLQSPPSPSSSALVDLALTAWFTLASLARASAQAPGCLRCLPHRRVSWMATATLTSPPCCARPLGREHDASPLAVAA
jgi:hypothetical protein